MKLLEIKNLSKTYSNGQNSITALNDINLIFPSSGFIGILGKSGCGKSTLLNLVAMLDKPSKGDIFYNGKSIYKMKKKKVNEYRNEEVSLLFQHYNLIEDLSVIENISLPMMINGYSKERSFKDAKSLLEKFGLSNDFATKIACNLSGGEKQRIALLRALINDPKIILADEPTGALDSTNSIEVMNLLKNTSKTKLVIVVSHNEKLIAEYADRVIRISYGRLVDDVKIKENENGTPVIEKVKQNKHKHWVDLLSLKSLKKDKEKYIIQSCSLVIGITSFLLSFGFLFESKMSLESECKNHLDYGVATISKVISDNSGGGLSIVKTFKPEFEEVIANKGIKENFFIEPNYDAVLPASSLLSIKGENITNCSLTPVYSFEGNCVDKGLLSEGRFPRHDSLKECVINKQAKRLLEDCFGDWKQVIHVENKCAFNLLNYGGPSSENIDVRFEVEVVGVVDELDFLSSPKMYYSFIGLDSYLDSLDTSIVNDNNGENLSWKSLILNSFSNDILSSYSYKLFAKNISSFSIPDLGENSNLEITSINIDISTALSQLFESVDLGIYLFVTMLGVGTILIIGIMNFSTFVEQKKRTAILYAIGAPFDGIMDIHVSNSLFISIISYVISILLSILISLIANVIIENTTGFKSLIFIPWFEWLGYKLLFPLSIFAAIVVIIVGTIYVPMAFCKRISISKELADE